MAVPEAGRAVHGSASGAQLAKLSSPASPVVTHGQGTSGCLQPNVTLVQSGTIAPGGAIAWAIDKLAPPLITGIVVSIIASLMIGRAMEKFRGSRDHLNRAVDALRSQLAVLQRISAEYWSSKAVPIKAVALEAEIEFTLQDISSLARVTAPDLWKSQEGDGPRLIADLLSAVTGPDFGAPNRTPNPQKIRDISARAAALSGRLLADRHHFFSKRSWWEAR